MPTLLKFAALQLLDWFTTLWFLGQGVEEGNPLVAALLRSSAHPAAILALLKVGACGLAWLAWRRNGTHLLRRVNVMFLACVGWNLIAIARATA